MPSSSHSRLHKASTTIASVSPSSFQESSPGFVSVLVLSFASSVKVARRLSVFGHYWRQHLSAELALVLAKMETRPPVGGGAGR